VVNGIPLSAGGLELAREWQTTGVPAAAVEADRPQALSGEWRGRGEAVELAVELTWRFGLPEPPEVAAPPAPPARAPGRTTLDPQAGAPPALPGGTGT